MKKAMLALLSTIILSACSPAIGSDEWCEQMKEKPKGDWTATESKDFAKHCIF
ncbi:DUF3012 domain-containing protein [Litorilituus sediminis]|uniref:DUF3012 domain-containing protein n=1 Tax=Litorilituus sediminis TaxID=718192 RepID=A0A4P6P7S1_9GAMM|nr:DUF3012 domain-containing protein [Litorilituus sediminis]QBG37118.1 DUF3012 domain-containing protein [Litorilituus sediminis]